MTENHKLLKSTLLPVKMQIHKLLIWLITYQTVKRHFGFINHLFKNSYLLIIMSENKRVFYTEISQSVFYSVVSIKIAFYITYYLWNPERNPVSLTLPSATIVNDLKSKSRYLKKPRVPEPIITIWNKKTLFIDCKDIKLVI